ncbi:MAG TPA: hypothetical protein VEW08_03285 [Steroidobacteraceae bacterium]|nr:hypothetical protein [Steroidobacteraceae bacterium]
MPTKRITIYLRAAALFAAWVLCDSSALAETKPADPAAALRARYSALSQQLDNSAIQRGLIVESNESVTTPRGDAYAVIQYPFATVTAAFENPANWCDTMILHLNVQYCRAKTGDGEPQLSTAVGKNINQPLDDTHRVDFIYKVTASTEDFLGVELVAKEGPLGTSDYRISLELTALPDHRSFMHIQYSYTQGAMARYVSGVYFSTKGRDKVGFTLVQDDDDEPRLVRGTRGALERNTMRYYLAFDAYLRSLSSPAPQRFEQSLEIWFADTERFARQLREVKHDDYMAMKRSQYQRQQTEAIKAGS